MEGPTQFNKPHCWQHEIRLKNYSEDLIESNFTNDYVKMLTIRDFEFWYVPKEDKETCLKIKEFIEKHEWLGKMPNRPTHRFIATHRGIIAGVVVMATPNSFSHLLGPQNKDLEKLISRGACISWSPVNLASWLIMNSINWMVANTSFRYFTAYSDTEAKELGTIYQSCNFIYLGKKSGTRYVYFDPNNPDRGWFSDRVFRKVGQYKKYALKLGINWDSSWNEGCRMLWERVPSQIHMRLAQAARDYQATCKQRKVPPKHKYVYIKGRNKRETRDLIKSFESANPKLKRKGPNFRLGLPYPKERGK